MHKLLDISGVEWYILEGDQVIMCVQTMVVVSNRHRINICVIGDKYQWSVIGILHKLSP